jgi:hypothetical protein
MTRQEIITKTVSDLSCPSDYLPVVTAELLKRLPDQTFKTCEDFRVGPAKCCETCHTYYAHYDMELVQLQDGVCAWICCDVRDAISSYDRRNSNSDQS